MGYIETKPRSDRCTVLGSHTKEMGVQHSENPDMIYPLCESVVCSFKQRKNVDYPVGISSCNFLQGRGPLIGPKDQGPRTKLAPEAVIVALIHHMEPNVFLGSPFEVVW